MKMIPSIYSFFLSSRLWVVKDRWNLIGKTVCLIILKFHFTKNANLLQEKKNKLKKLSKLDETARFFVNFTLNYIEKVQCPHFNK